MGRGSRHRLVWPFPELDRYSTERRSLPIYDFSGNRATTEFSLAVTCCSKHERGQMDGITDRNLEVVSSRGRDGELTRRVSRGDENRFASADAKNTYVRKRLARICVDNSA